MAIAFKESPLPDADRVSLHIDSWAGVNKIKGSEQKGEMADCVNMSSDKFPYASPRQGRSCVIENDNIERMFLANVTINGRKAAHYIDGDGYIWSEWHSSSGQVSKNKYQYKNADGEYVDVVIDGKVKCTNYFGDGVMVYPSLNCFESNRLYTPKKPVVFPGYQGTYATEGYYGDGIATKMSTRAYVENGSGRPFKVRVELPPEDELSFPSSGEYDKQFTVSVTSYDKDDNRLDGTSLTVSADEFESESEARCKEWSVDIPVSENGYLEFRVSYSNYSGASVQNYWESMMYFISSGNWTIEAENDKSGNPCVSKLDYGILYNNRIVGVSGNKIRCSGLGDLVDFTEFVDEAGNPSSTGAYATDVGGEGDFTGICAYNNVVLLFKENIVYEMYGSMPYTITKLCETGCVDNDSIVSIDGVLYWASPKGIVQYGGGVPRVISQRVDIDINDLCKAGTDGRKYYAWDGKKIFVYDTYYGMWHTEDLGDDGTEVRMFYNNLTQLYMVTDKGIYLVDGGDGCVEWEFTTPDFNFQTTSRKTLSRLWLRAEMPPLSEIQVYVCQNGGQWERRATKTAERDEMFDFKLKVKKCDSFALKIKGRGSVKILDLHGRVTLGTSRHRSGESLNVYRK